MSHTCGGFGLSSFVVTLVLCPRGGGFSHIFFGTFCFVRILAPLTNREDSTFSPVVDWLFTNRFKTCEYFPAYYVSENGRRWLIESWPASDPLRLKINVLVVPEHCPDDTRNISQHQDWFCKVREAWLRDQNSGSAGDGKNKVFVGWGKAP